MPADQTETCYAKGVSKSGLGSVTSDSATWSFDFTAWLLDMTSVSPAVPSATPPMARWEGLVLGGLLLIVITLRFAFPGRLAIEHFDEGVYASNIWFGDRPEGTYPAQHLYAPPLLPTLIELCFLVSGPSNAAAMWPSQMAGVSSVLLLWWIGRSWFGPVAGLVAGGLCATNEVLILLSRSALTDSLLGMWWLAALWSLRRACDSGSALDRLLAGVLIGLAWFTKYNGWMPLGIVTGAVLLRGILCRGLWAQTRTALATCLVAGVISFAVWSPWLWSLQSKGGYASVAANHRQYIVGPAGWLGSAARQSEQLQAMLGPISKLGFDATYLVLLLAFVWVGRNPRTSPVTTNSSRTSPAATAGSQTPNIHAVFAVLFFGLASLGPLAPVCSAVALVILGLLASCGRLRTSRNAQRQPAEIDLGYWILVVWFGGMLVATPLYSPYLRLTQPAVLATCLGVGLAFGLAWETFRHEYENRTWSLAMRLMVTAQVVVISVGIYIQLSRATAEPGGPVTRDSWTPSMPNQDSLPMAARGIAESIGEAAGRSASELPVVVYVYAEPSLLFQLRLAGVQNVAPVSSLQFAKGQFSTSSARIFLATGIHSQKDSRFREEFDAARGQYRRVGRWPWKLGPLVALDQPECDPKLLGRNPLESAAIELYEVLPPQF